MFALCANIVYMAKTSIYFCERCGNGRVGYITDVSSVTATCTECGYKKIAVQPFSLGVGSKEIPKDFTDFLTKSMRAADAAKVWGRYESI